MENSAHLASDFHTQGSCGEEMKLNKRLQYGLLLALYLCRSGRATIEGASEGLGLSTSFLTQVARSLRIAGVIKSVRGAHGGYELKGEPTVLDVFNALSPVQLLNKAESAAYSKGHSEHRALYNYVINLGHAWGPLLRRKVRNVGMELVVNELARLNRAQPTQQAN